jgi:hypothetical protein
MDLLYLINGNLEMNCSNKGETRQVKGLIKYSKNLIEAESKFIYIFLQEFKQVKPEDVGALTNAAIIQKDGVNYGDMEYQTQSFLETLSNGGKVIWTKR